MLPAVITGWIKYHSDGSFTDGNDYDVKAGRASWSRSPLDNITSVTLFEIVSFNDSGFLSARIDGPGEYHQSDDFIVPVLSSGVVTGQRVVRRIERKITSQDTHMYINHRVDSLTISFVPPAVEETDTLIFQKIRPEMVGKWLIVEINKQKNNVKWYLSDDKI